MLEKNIPQKSSNKRHSNANAGGQQAANML